MDILILITCWLIINNRRLHTGRGPRLLHEEERRGGNRKCWSQHVNRIFSSIRAVVLITWIMGLNGEISLGIRELYHSKYHYGTNLHDDLLGELPITVSWDLISYWTDIAVCCMQQWKHDAMYTVPNREYRGGSWLWTYWGGSWTYWGSMCLKEKHHIRSCS